MRREWSSFACQLSESRWCQQQLRGISKQQLWTEKSKAEDLQPNSCAPSRKTTAHGGAARRQLDRGKKTRTELWWLWEPAEKGREKRPHLRCYDGLQAGSTAAGEVAHHLDAVGSAAEVRVDPEGPWEGGKRKKNDEGEWEKNREEMRDGRKGGVFSWCGFVKATSHRRSSSARSCKGPGRSVRGCLGSPAGSWDFGSACWGAAGFGRCRSPDPRVASPCSANRREATLILLLIMIRLTTKLKGCGFECDQVFSCWIQ